MNRRIRIRTYGGVGGRLGQPGLLPDAPLEGGQPALHTGNEGLPQLLSNTPINFSLEQVQFRLESTISTTMVGLDV